jgi:PAS domain S-box-containing protein
MHFAIEHCPDALYLVRADGTLAYVNDAACRMLGYSRDEMETQGIRALGLTFLDEIGSKSAARPRLREGGARLGVQRTKDGRSLAVEVFARSLGHCGSCVFVREVRTPAHRMEASERAALTGSVAHDFKNLLMAIGGYVELASQDHSALRQQAHFDQIRRLVERAADISTRLVRSTQNDVAACAPFDAHGPIAEVAEALKVQADPRVRIVLNLGAAQADVNGDATAFQSAVLNLALNAVDAMPEGGLLTIATASTWLGPKDCSSALERLSPGPYLRVTVTDTGVGMDAKTLARVPEAFFTTKDPARGTGLGLYSVSETVRALAGGLEIESEMQLGTRVRVFLPLASGYRA